MIVPYIEEGARWTVEENDKRGPIIVRWRPWVELLQPDGLVSLEGAAPAAELARGVE